jgi:CDP-6-deoxy-D-xylo-4-hexulose-3-dehydrase
VRAGTTAADSTHAYGVEAKRVDCDWARNTQLTDGVEELFAAHRRRNESQPSRYWYPLSRPTYGVEEVVEALDSLCSFRTSMGEKTRMFERQFAAFQRCSDSVMVNSGSSADLLLCFLLTNPLRPLLQPGDEILVPVVTWPTQLWSAMMAGLKVRLVDVDPATLNVDLDDLESEITPATRAIFVVHLMGNPCRMDRVLELARQHNLIVIEDCCEALGAEWDGVPVGNFGLGGSFSFFFSHHITTMEGGMITCPDAETADQLRILRAHGWLRNVDPATFRLADDELDPRYAFINWGFNVRPTEVQAGFGLHQLEKLPAFNRRRDILAGRFFDFVDHLPCFTRPVVHPLARPSWLALPVLVRPDAPFSRREITTFLEQNGVETRPIVAGNLAKQPAAKLFGLDGGNFPGADEIHWQGFYVGLSPMQDDQGFDRLLDLIHGFVHSKTARRAIAA